MAFLKMQTRYYYRGTTRGWAGNPVLRDLKITCVTTDPFVAILFAIECRNHGQAAVLIAAKAEFETIEGENFFAIPESAVNLAISPEEFEDRAVVVVEVDRAIAVLEELGFHPIPIRLTSLGHLQREILETYASMRLTLAQILEFDQRIGLEGETES